MARLQQGKLQRILLTSCSCVFVYACYSCNRYKRMLSLDRSGRSRSTVREDDKDCIFRYSSLYRKIYVYPTPGEPEWEEQILSPMVKNVADFEAAPWLAVDKEWRENGEQYYDPTGFAAQFSTELLVREIFVHPDSCLRTMDPNEATLFFVPYMSGIDFHSRGAKARHKTTKWGQSVEDAINGDYRGWEQVWGLTSEFWKKRNGADHILVYSSPIQGITHPRYKRGSYHYIHTQHQLAPPIAISVELSTTFVRTYPKCAAKNILVPYPVTDGRYFNGKLDDIVASKMKNASLVGNTNHWVAALETEKDIYHTNTDMSMRIYSQYYRAGVHGSCVALRRSLQKDFKCSKSFEELNRLNMRFMYVYGMRLSTFCPTPGGDSPSAKRMFDAVLAGCIPVVLSDDFVWPFSTDHDSSNSLEPASFALRYPGSKFDTVKHNSTCGLSDQNDPSLQSILEKVPSDKILSLRRGLSASAHLYQYYANNESIPDNPLKHRMLPNGGAALELIRALEKRAGGELWLDCEKELVTVNRTLGLEPDKFRC